MLRSSEELYGYTIQATDAEVGEVDDFFFDDARWLVRYLVVETGEWLGGRQVLVAREALGEPNWLAGILPVNLTEEQIEHSPPTDWNKPVSQQHEAELHTHYGWDYYRLSLQSPVQTEEMDVTEAGPLPADTDGPHLRSSRMVTGYNLRAADGKIGHVANMLLDDKEWMVRYLVVDTRDWLLGKQVLIATEWVDTIDWTHNSVHVDATKEMVKGSPEYDPTAPITREYEENLYDYYARPKYWL